MSSQARWLLAATCAIVAAGAVFRADPPDRHASAVEHVRVVESEPRPAEETTPFARDAASDETSIRGESPSTLRSRRPSARARLRKARREARLRARRSGTSTAMLLDTDGYPVPFAVAAQGDRFPLASPMDASELAQGLGGPTGNVSFWFQPRWNEGNQDDASFVEIADGRLRVLKNVDFLRVEFVTDDGVEHGLGAEIADWKPGEWHQIAATWDGGTVRLYFDGALVRETEAPLVLPEQPRMFVGSDFPDYRPAASGIVGGLQADGRPLSADEVRRRFAHASG